MERLTLEQIATQYGENNGTFGTMEPLASAFEAGAEWQKEQHKILIGDIRVECRNILACLINSNHRMFERNLLESIIERLQD